jgi:hypothetical protein
MKEAASYSSVIVDNVAPGTVHAESGTIWAELPFVTRTGSTGGGGFYAYTYCWQSNAGVYYPCTVPGPGPQGPEICGTTTFTLEQTVTVNNKPGK